MCVTVMHYAYFHDGINDAAADEDSDNDGDDDDGDDDSIDITADEWLGKYLQYVFVVATDFI